MLAGHVMVGLVVSTTLTENVQVDCTRKTFVATQVTVLEPRGKMEPDVGEQTTSTGSREASVAVAV